MAEVLRSCLRNVVSMFHIIEKEQSFRKRRNLPEGFEALRACKPIGRDVILNLCEEKMDLLTS